MRWTTWREIGSKMSGSLYIVNPGLLVAHLNILAKISLLTLNHMIRYSSSEHPATGSFMWNKLRWCFLAMKSHELPACRPPVIFAPSICPLWRWRPAGHQGTSYYTWTFYLYWLVQQPFGWWEPENIIGKHVIWFVFFYDYVRIFNSFSSRTYERSKILFKII